jgi:hypothetical protein
MLLVCTVLLNVQMKLLDEPYSSNKTAPETEPGEGAALTQLLTMLRLHFAHLTEHIQELAAQRFTVGKPDAVPKRQLVHRTVHAPLSAQARQLQGTVSKLVRTPAATTELSFCTSPHHTARRADLIFARLLAVHVQLTRAL